jgi:hypothetical protein
VEPLPVLSINYSGESHGPWPRILKILALVALVFGGLKVGATALTIHTAWPGTKSAQYSSFLISWSIETALDLAMATGGLWLLMHPGRYRPLMLAGWTWCAVTVLGLVFQSFVRFPPFTIEYVVAGMLYGAIQAAFPILVILLLSQYRKEQQIVGQPNVPAAFRRWPGRS